MVELVQLEQLLLIAECGTLSQAAEKLHLSQPALSRSMQRLEAELQVALFDRQKNRVHLNENGRLAVEYARRIVGAARDMAVRIHAFDRSQRTILVGSCAPAPLWEISQMLSELYPDRTISTEIRENQTLLQGLREGVYQLIVLPCAVEEPGLAWVKYGEEHLFFSLPPAHPLAGKKSLFMGELNGETMLLRNRLGFWRDLVAEKMPDSRFLEQESVAFNELVKLSALPSFATDVVLHRAGFLSNRVNIPILDQEANVTYYCLFQREKRTELATFLERISPG